MMSQPVDTVGQDVTTILYVDDEEMARKYFARLVGADYAVLTAANADEAIRALRENEIDILVTDYRMPGRDGGALLRQAWHEFPYVVRILVTAYADRNVLLDSLNSGEVFRLIEKPMQADEIKNILRLAQEVARERRSKRQRLRAIDETLAFLAHELNTPLSAIVNFAGGMQRRLAEVALPPGQQLELGDAVSAIDDNARYCLTLLSAFVSSVQESNALAGQRGYGSAAQLISSLLDTYPLSPAQRAMVSVKVRDDFQIPALPNCVSLVLSSILGNALQALQGSAAPMINFTVQVAGVPQICIQDNGHGIPPEILERLLVDPVTSRSGAEGRGWGMIFCKRIMQAFGGSIQVNSVPDASTTVTLHFPAVKIKTNGEGNNE